MSEDLKRVTVTLSDRHFDYLDQKMEKTNMTRTSLVQLAIETWINQSEQMDVMAGLVAESQKLREEAQKGEI